MVCMKFENGTFVLGKNIEISRFSVTVEGRLLSDCHGVDGVKIPGDVLPFSNDGVDGRMEAMVVLRSKPENGDMAISLRQFIVPDQPSDAKLIALTSIKTTIRNTLIQYVVTSVTG